MTTKKPKLRLGGHMKKKFEKIIDIEPAFDGRSDDPKKNYGIHGCNIRFVLKGKFGATQFLIFSNWHFPQVTDDLIKTCLNDPYNSRLSTNELIKLHLLPYPADLGYHSVKPKDGQQPSFDCKYTKTGKCYYDGSSLNAEPLMNVLLEKGSDGIWDELEKYYYQVFEKDRHTRNPYSAARKTNQLYARERRM